MATLRQKKAFARVGENGGVISAAMVDVGYSENTAKTPQKLTESDGWKELMQKYLPDDLLAQRHQELLNKREVVKAYNHETGETEVQVTDQPDTQAVSKALDMGYKLKGAYAPEKTVNLNLNADMKQLDPKVVTLKDEYEKKLLEQILG